MSRGHRAPELPSARAAPACRSPRPHPAAQGLADAAGGSRAPGGRTAGPRSRGLRAWEASSPGRPGQPRRRPSSLEGDAAEQSGAFSAVCGDLLGPDLSSRPAPEGQHRAGLCPFQVAPRKAGGDCVPAVVPPRREERLLLGKTSISLCVSLWECARSAEA